MDAKYTWKRGHAKSVERSPDISLPQMDLVGIEAAETTDTYSIGKINTEALRNKPIYFFSTDYFREDDCNRKGVGCL